MKQDRQEISADRREQLRLDWLAMRRISIAHCLQRQSAEPEWFDGREGGIGNNIFNGIIFVWVGRQKMPSIIGSTLAMDAGVWLVVQSIKLIPFAFGEWALRPNGVMGGFPSGHIGNSIYLTTLFVVRPRCFAWSWVEAARHTPPQVTAFPFHRIFR